ncbi:hypothetical protein PRJ39_06475 [Lysobacter enzymogenes]|uniref:hypothetical protein n=1 Tax=Lysobacter TaxID=68 RepID=UPI0020C88346|nr:hypothetical protein [Lysobacter sp. yr284]
MDAAAQRRVAHRVLNQVAHQHLQLALVADAFATTTAALLLARHVGRLSWGVLTKTACGLAMLVAGTSKAFGEALEVLITVNGRLILAGANILN